MATSNDVTNESITTPLSANTRSYDMTSSYIDDDVTISENQESVYIGDEYTIEETTHESETETTTMLAINEQGIHSPDYFNAFTCIWLPSIYISKKIPFIIFIELKQFIKCKT